MLNEEKRAELVQSLRDFADWIEETPEAILDSWGDVWVTFYGATKEQVVALAQTPGKFTKRFSGGSMELERSFGSEESSRVRYMMSVPREQVCEAKVVGKKMVERRNYEAERAIPKIMVEEDVIEWECTPLLASAEEE